jgi:hypothetical protein
MLASCRVIAARYGTAEYDAVMPSRLGIDG